MPSETTQIIIQYNQSTQKFESPLPGVIDSSQMICKYNPEKDTIEYTKIIDIATDDTIDSTNNINYDTILDATDFIIEIINTSISESVKNFGDSPALSRIAGGKAIAIELPISYAKNLQELKKEFGDDYKNAESIAIYHSIASVLIGGGAGLGAAKALDFLLPHIISKAPFLIPYSLPAKIVAIAAASWLAKQICDSTKSKTNSAIDSIHNQLISTLNSFAPKDPLVIDLNGDGLRLGNWQESGVSFDLDGNGFSENAGWVMGDVVDLHVDL